MNRKQKKLRYIRTKNAYRFFRIPLLSANSITISGKSYSFKFEDVAGKRGNVLLFTNEFYNKIF